MFVTGINPAETYTSATLPFKQGTVGAHTPSSDGIPRLYKLVQYNSGAGAVAAAAGNVAYYFAPSGTSTGVTAVVTSDLSDSSEVGAGVLQAVIATGEFGWIQLTGPATLNTALTAGADGDPLTATGATDGTLDVSSAATDHICAVAIDASAKIVLCHFPF
jgi:hypothetical protein